MLVSVRVLEVIIEYSCTYSSTLPPVKLGRWRDARFTAARKTLTFRRLCRDAKRAALPPTASATQHHPERERRWHIIPSERGGGTSSRASEAVAHYLERARRLHSVPRERGGGTYIIPSERGGGTSSRASEAVAHYPDRNLHRTRERTRGLESKKNTSLAPQDTHTCARAGKGTDFSTLLGANSSA